MADKGDLRNMVMTFRVSELQLLLGLTNQSRCGRKTELLQRALNLIDRGVSAAVQQKIREIFRKYTPPHRAAVGAGFSVPIQQNNCVSATNRATVNHCAAVTASNVAHQQRATTATASHMRVEVAFKRLPFYDVLGEIMKPSSLVARSAGRMQETRFQIYLAQQHIEEINYNRDLRYADRVEYNVQVQLRFCVVDASCRQPDCFPSGVGVKVNNMPATLPNVIPTNKPGVEPKRPNRPVDITRLCRFSSTFVNTITVNWAFDDTRSHCVAVFLVRKLDSNILLQRLKRSGVRRADVTKAMVREKLSLDEDSDLSTTSLRISLLCPLGKMRMTVPCRASTCNHLQCYDATTYLMMNEKKPTWMCPVCDRPAEFNRLIIDGLVSEILRESGDATEVELTRDGQWHVTKTEDFDCPSPEPTVVQNIIHDTPQKLQSVASAPIKAPAPSITATPAASAATAAACTVSGNDCTVIDLTESDDETVAMTTASATTAFARTNGVMAKSPQPAHSTVSRTTVSSHSHGTVSSSHVGTVSSPSPPVVFDLSPLNIPVSSSPLIHHSLPPSPLMVPTPPLLAAASLGPSSFHPAFPTPSAKLTNIPFLGGSSSSSSSSAYSTLPSSASSSFSYPTNSLFTRSPYDNDAMLDFLTLMSGLSDFPGFSIAPNTFDYLYQSNATTNTSSRGAAGLDFGLDSVLRGSPSPTI